MTTIGISLVALVVAGASLWGHRRRAPSPSTLSATGAAEVLEANLNDFATRLGADLGRLRPMAPSFTSLFTEIGLTVLVLEYLLHAKGLVREGELTEAVETALGLARRKALLDNVAAGTA